jgi:hypothetical protein
MSLVTGVFFDRAGWYTWATNLRIPRLNHIQTFAVLIVGFGLIIFLPDMVREVCRYVVTAVNRRSKSGTSDQQSTLGDHK